MQHYDSNGSCAFFARVFAALVLAIGLGLMGSPASAAPFAYVTNSGANTVSVIDTPANKVVATIPVGGGAGEVAVTPDGKHAYVTGSVVSVIDTGSNKVVATVPVSGSSAIAITPDGKRAYVAGFPVSVIDTATNKVVATFTAGPSPSGIAITPDGKHAYIPSFGSVDVIATATNTVVASVGFDGGGVQGVAIAPDGKHAYVTTNVEPFPEFGSVAVIDTATNTVVAGVGIRAHAPDAVAITPDGRHAYVTAFDSNTVSVIDTASNSVVATVPGVGGPGGIAVTPDGKHVYVAAGGVSEIATASNTVVATVPVPAGAGAVGIVPPPPGVPFLAFSAQLAIHFGGAPNQDSFNLRSQFTLSSTAPGIHPVVAPVTLQVGTFTTTIPAGSFTKRPDGSFTFAGVIHGVNLQALITPTGTLRYAFQAAATGANLTGTKNEVQVSLIIGGDSGTTSVNATNLGGLGVALR